MSSESQFLVRRKSLSSCSSDASSSSNRLPRWLEEAQRRIFASDEFKAFTREVVQCVQQRKPDGLAEQHKLVDDAYNRIVDAGSSRSGPLFEAFVCSEMDAALCSAVAARQATATKQHNAIATIERYAATGIVGLLSVLPRHDYQGAFAALIGRALPPQLRVPLWTRCLQHMSAEEEFYRLQRIDRIAMADPTVADRCEALLGKHLDGLRSAELTALKSALS